MLIMIFSTPARPDTPKILARGLFRPYYGVTNRLLEAILLAFYSSEQKKVRSCKFVFEENSTFIFK